MTPVGMTQQLTPPCSFYGHVFGAALELEP